MPDMFPATWMDGTCESWSVPENSIFQQLLLLLQPPHSHSFRLEMYTMGQVTEKGSCILLMLECGCSRKLLMEDTLFFLSYIQ